MSKTEIKPEKKRGTRLKGTALLKPCAGCGEMKDRFKDFKPRWAGCEKHRTERGRRYHQSGCQECHAKVNGNIRQPRCIGCDRARVKRTKKPAKAVAVATVETPKAEAAPVVVEPKAAKSPDSVDVTPGPDLDFKIESVADLSKLFGGIGG